MKIHIDISVMSDTEAFGYLHGPIELSFPPRSGDYLSLTNPKDDVFFPNVEGFTGRLRIDSVTHWPGHRADGIEISLMLGDVIVSSRDEARKVALYLETAYSLFWDEFEPNQT